MRYTRWLIDASPKFPIYFLKVYSSADADIEYVFDVDFANLGIDLNRTAVDGIVDVEIANNDLPQLEATSSVESVPLQQIEQAYFRSIGLLA